MLFGFLQERLLKCVKMIQELSSNSSASVPCVPQSPIGVLDAVCFSYRSDDTNAGGSCSSSHNNSPDAKRRKLNKTCGEELL